MKKNYKYARLDRGNFEYAPNIIYIGDKQIINASAETYKAQGYLPVVNTEQPESTETHYFTPYYVEENGKVIQRWERYEVTI